MGHYCRFLPLFAGFGAMREEENVLRFRYCWFNITAEPMRIWKNQMKTCMALKLPGLEHKFRSLARLG
jgi:hypothetical protein